MAISPPSDIVLDVARAADPAAVAEARAVLMRRAQGPGASFEPDLATPAAGAGPRLSRSQGPQALPEASRKFEAMVLQTFISSMMPKNAEGTFGQGIAGDMWKSMMAEKIADVVAERGGIGIAQHVMGDFQMVGETPVPLTGVTSETDFSDGNHPQAVASALVEQIERQMAKEVTATSKDTGGLFTK